MFVSHEYHETVKLSQKCGWKGEGEWSSPFAHPRGPFILTHREHRGALEGQREAAAPSLKPKALSIFAFFRVREAQTWGLYHHCDRQSLDTEVSRR